MGHLGDTTRHIDSLKSIRDDSSTPLAYSLKFDSGRLPRHGRLPEKPFLINSFGEPLKRS